MIPHYPLGVKECQCHNYFQDPEDARASAADMMLRVIQADLANAYLQHQHAQQQLAAAAAAAAASSNVHFSYPTAN